MKTTIYNRFTKAQQQTRRTLLPGILFLGTILLLNSCRKDAVTNTNPTLSKVTSSVSAAADDLSMQNIEAGQMVLTWNNAANVAVARMTAVTGIPVSPPPDSRILAMINVAMHDALNTIVPRYERYALTDAIDCEASPSAAVAQAAHDVIISLLPPQQTYADSLLTVSLSSISDGTTKTKGIALGKAAALAMMGKRANDGATTAQFFVAQGTAPGQYRSTPPNNVTGFIGLPGWGNITPFALTSGSQFRPKIPPYPIKSVAYAKDYNELKTAGGIVSSVRTPDQTEYAKFWLPNIPFMFDNIARTLIAQKNVQDAWRIARLFSLLEMAEADANIACFDAKYYYFFWRPYTAIHLGDSDGNKLTVADTTWQSLIFPIPASPDYPSNHATNAAAGAAVVAAFFDQNNFDFSLTSPALPGITRSYSSLSQVVREIGLSRIYVGFHFRHAVDVGVLLGTEVGLYTYSNALKPVRNK